MTASRSTWVEWYAGCVEAGRLFEFSVVSERRKGEGMFETETPAPEPEPAPDDGGDEG